MRQGPNYSMPLSIDDLDRRIIYIPLELIDDFSCPDYVVWTANPDGTYTLRPVTNYN